MRRPLGVTDSMTDLTKVDGQVGTLVLDSDGNIKNATGEWSGDNGSETAATVYQMLQDCAKILSKTESTVQPLTRLTVSGAKHNYLATMATDEIYVVKKAI